MSRSLVTAHMRLLLLLHLFLRIVTAYLRLLLLRHRYALPIDRATQLNLALLYSTQHSTLLNSTDRTGLNFTGAPHQLAAIGG